MSDIDIRTPPCPIWPECQCGGCAGDDCAFSQEIAGCMDVSASRRWIWFMWTVLCLAALIAILGLAWPALAHDAPSTAAQPRGWSYPFSCCSGYDCRPVPEAAITERPEGYVIAGTGEVVGYQDSRVKRSPDGEFHWCSVAGAADGRTICLFVPPRSF